MSKIVRYRFMGSWWWLWVLCVSGIGPPLAVLYLLTGTVRWTLTWTTQNKLPKTCTPASWLKKVLTGGRTHRRGSECYWGFFTNTLDLNVAAAIYQTLPAPPIPTIFRSHSGCSFRA